MSLLSDDDGSMSPTAISRKHPQTYHFLTATPTVLQLPEDDDQPPHGGDQPSARQQRQAHTQPTMLPATTILSTPRAPGSSGQAWTSARAGGTQTGTLSRRHTSTSHASPTTAQPAAQSEAEVPVPANPAGRGAASAAPVAHTDQLHTPAQLQTQAVDVLHQDAQVQQETQDPSPSPPHQLSLYLEARVWRDCTWASLMAAATASRGARGGNTAGTGTAAAAATGQQQQQGQAAGAQGGPPPTQDQLQLSGLHCAVRLGPPEALTLRATEGLRVTRVWVINNTDCRVWGARVVRSRRTLRTDKEGPSAWEIGTSVDVVVRLECQETGQVYLLRCADEGVGVEVVFTTWQLLCVLGRLLWAMVVAAFITPLQSGALHLWEACLHSHLVHLLKQACWRAREALGGHCGVQQVGPVYISLSRSSSISGLSLASSSRGSRGRGGGSSGGSSPAVSRRGTGGGASA